eukprot:363588-Chlamydomonas_euryale.AAC.1
MLTLPPLMERRICRPGGCGCGDGLAAADGRRGLASASGATSSSSKPWVPMQRASFRPGLACRRHASATHKAPSKPCRAVQGPGAMQVRCRRHAGGMKVRRRRHASAMQVRRRRHAGPGPNVAGRPL